MLIERPSSKDIWYSNEEPLLYFVGYVLICGVIY
jgi:hypothetical protein